MIVRGHLIAFGPASSVSVLLRISAEIEEATTCARSNGVLTYGMKTLKVALGFVIVSLVGTQFAAADSRADKTASDDVPVRYAKASKYHEPLAPAVLGSKTQGKLVFVTGSRIPQRVQVKAIGTATTSPVRVYTREEIDRTGAHTTRDILAQDPSIRVIGH